MGLPVCVRTNAYSRLLEAVYLGVLKVVINNKSRCGHVDMSPSGTHLINGSVNVAVSGTPAGRHTELHMSVCLNNRTIK